MNDGLQIVERLIIMKKKIILIFVLVSYLLVSKQVMAKTEQNNPLGFSIEAVTSENQIDNEIPYFYLKTEPGKSQQVKVKVTGTSKEPVKIKTYLANAGTSDAGSINYLPKNEADETLKDSLEEIATVEPTDLELKQGETKEVVITINPPTTNYDGIKLGSVYFERADKTEEEGMVKSAFSYNVAIMLSESDTTTNDGKEFKLLSVKPQLVKAQKTVTLRLQNPEPKMISDLSMKVQIVNKKNNKVVKTQKLEKGSVAPNSHFDFSVDWGLDVIPAGKYIAKVQANSNSESWSLEKEFEITSEQAKKMNEESLYKLELPNWAYVSTVLLGIMTVIVSVYLVIRGKKWKKELLKGKKGSSKGKKVSKRSR